MPRRQSNPELHVIVHPVPVPENIADWQTWDTVCVPVPVPLIQYIPDLLKPLRWKGRAIGTELEKALFSELWEDLISRFVSAEKCAESGQAMRLRQNPANSCQLQQSFDNGATWSLAFDYSLCRNRMTEFIFETEINNLFQSWSTTTNNTQINQFAPTLTFTSTTGETQERTDARILALCYATKLYVYAYCEAIKEINHDASLSANLVALGLGVATALAALATIGTTGATLPLYLALSAALTAAGGATYSALTDAVLDDTGAKDELACCMFNSLQTLMPTAENFATAVDACPGLSANAEIIRSTLAVDISNPAGLENQFNAFINLLGDSVRPAELGLIDDCPCFPPVEYCDDLAAGLGSMTQEASGLAPFAQWNVCNANFTGQSGGVFTAGAGESGSGAIVGVHVCDSDPTFHLSIEEASVRIDLGAEFTFKNANMRYENISVGGSLSQIIVLLDDTGEVINAAGNNPAVAAGWRTFDFTDSVEGVRYITFHNIQSAGGTPKIGQICVSYVE